LYLNFIKTFANSLSRIDRISNINVTRGIENHLGWVDKIQVDSFPNPLLYIF
jgi:hypothetical protein